MQQGEGHYQPTRLRDGQEWQPDRTLSLQVPCRQCAACLRNRARGFARRAKQEFKTAQDRGLRTWFGTMTFRPEERYRLLTQTRIRLDAQGVNLEALGPTDRYREQIKDSGPAVSKFLRALRKGRKKLGARPTFFRYLLTTEPHKDWVPHYHVLIHEVSDLYPIRKKALEDLWSHGHVQWRLVTDPKVASYAAKYLAKFSMARVRVSKKYGVIDTV